MENQILIIIVSIYTFLVSVGELLILYPKKSIKNENELIKYIIRCQFLNIILMAVFLYLFYQAAPKCLKYLYLNKFKKE